MDQSVKVYVNKEYECEATEGMDYDEMAIAFTDITWRQLLADCLDFELSGKDADLEDVLEDFGISLSELDDKLPDWAMDRWFTEIEMRFEDTSGASAKLYNRIVSMDLIELVDGCGSDHGVTLSRQSGNGIRKCVQIEDEKSAAWLSLQAGARGIHMEIVFV
jgi:hypothetical protein